MTRTAVGVGLAIPHERAADRVLAMLVPVAERCAAAGRALWMRAWPSGQAADVWVLLAALMEKVPALRAGVVASFPASTRVADIEDLLVIDNLSGGRVDLAFAPDAEAEAVREVIAALRGEALSRPDPGGTPRAFPLTPRPARGAIATWTPRQGSVWRLAGEGGEDLHILDAGPGPSVADIDRLMHGTEGGG
jgi:hypothetical protein